jgi:hypothetical protein
VPFEDATRKLVFTVRKLNEIDWAFDDLDKAKPVI